MQKLSENYKMFLALKTNQRSAVSVIPKKKKLGRISIGASNAKRRNQTLYLFFKLNFLCKMPSLLHTKLQEKYNISFSLPSVVVKTT